MFSDFLIVILYACVPSRCWEIMGPVFGRSGFYPVLHIWSWKYFLVLFFFLLSLSLSLSVSPPFFPLSLFLSSCYLLVLQCPYHVDILACCYCFLLLHSLCSGVIGVIILVNLTSINIYELFRLWVQDSESKFSFRHAKLISTGASCRSHALPPFEWLQIKPRLRLVVIPQDHPNNHTEHLVPWAIIWWDEVSMTLTSLRVIGTCFGRIHSKSGKTVEWQALVLDKATFDMILGPLEDLNKRGRVRQRIQGKWGKGWEKRDGGSFSGVVRNSDRAIDQHCQKIGSWSSARAYDPLIFFDWSCHAYRTPLACWSRVATTKHTLYHARMTRQASERVWRGMGWCLMDLTEK